MNRNWCANRDKEQWTNHNQKQKHKKKKITRDFAEETGLHGAINVRGTFKTSLMAGLLAYLRETRAPVGVKKVISSTTQE